MLPMVIGSAQGVDVFVPDDFLFDSKSSTNQSVHHYVGKATRTPNVGNGVGEQNIRIISIGLVDDFKSVVLLHFSGLSVFCRCSPSDIEVNAIRRIGDNGIWELPV